MRDPRTLRLFLVTGLLLGLDLGLDLGREAIAAPDNTFVHSGVGPGSDQGAISLGGRFYVAPTTDLVIPIPTFELNWIRGFSDRFDYELRITTLGIFSLVETGFRMRLIGDHAFSIAARGDGTIGLLLVGGSEGGGVGALFGATPGVLVSLGNRATQLSFGMDVPLLLGAAVTSTFGGDGGGTGFEWILRPAIALEFPVSDSMHMVIAAQAYVNPRGDKASESILPSLGVGVSW